MHTQVCCTQNPAPVAGHCCPVPLQETQTQFWLSLCGDYGSWCAQDFVCALQESVSPVLPKFWWLYGGVNCNLLQEGFCHTQVCSTQSPCPCSRPLLTHTSKGDTQTLKGRSGSGSVESPGVHKVLSVPPKSLFPQFGVSSAGSLVGLIVISSKRAYAIPRSAVPRAPALEVGHCLPVPPQETLKHSKAGLVQSLWGLLVHIRYCLSPLSISGRYGI